MIRFIWRQETIFPDALSGSALAAKNNVPIFLTDKNSISSDTINFLKSKGVQHVVILGGTGAVSQAVSDIINNIKVTTISLNKTSDTLTKGGDDYLVATVSPIQGVKWTSSNPSVASISPDNNNYYYGYRKITAIIPGIAQ